jgi:hypothetical protein
VKPAAAQHDCFGAILQAPKDGPFYFVCMHCGRPFAVLSEKGMTVHSKHGSQKHENVISLKALKAMIAAVEKA